MQNGFYESREITKKASTVMRLLFSLLFFYCCIPWLASIPEVFVFFLLNNDTSILPKR